MQTAVPFSPSTPSKTETATFSLQSLSQLKEANGVPPVFAADDIQEVVEAIDN